MKVEAEAELGDGEGGTGFAVVVIFVAVNILAVLFGTGDVTDEGEDNEVVVGVDGKEEELGVVIRWNEFAFPLPLPLVLILVLTKFEEGGKTGGMEDFPTILLPPVEGVEGGATEDEWDFLELAVWGRGEEEEEEGVDGAREDGEEEEGMGLWGTPVMGVFSELVYMRERNRDRDSEREEGWEGEKEKRRERKKRAEILYFIFFT